MFEQTDSISNKNTKSFFATVVYTESTIFTARDFYCGKVMF